MKILKLSKNHVLHSTAFAAALATGLIETEQIGHGLACPDETRWK